MNTCTKNPARTQSRKPLLVCLLLNIVSTRENLKFERNIHILKHYGLDWVIDLDREYERLIAN
jgi:hypothetical protein